MVARIARSWPERWLPMACCLPGLGLAFLVGGALLLAAPVLGLDAGTPALVGLIVMGIACPLTKLVAVLVFRRRIACPMPARRGSPDPADELGALLAESNRLGEQIATLRAPGR